jgi:hypothetical protein
LKIPGNNGHDLLSYLHNPLFYSTIILFFHDKSHTSEGRPFATLYKPIKSTIMKTSKVKFVLAAALVAVGVTAVSVYSCEKEDVNPTGLSSSEMDARAAEVQIDLPSPINVCGDVKEEYIVSEKGKIGKAIIFNDSKYFYVLLRSSKGITISEAIMHAEGKSGMMPLNEEKNPKISAFEYRLDPKPNATLVKFQIPIAEIGKMSFVAISIAAIDHTMVKSTGGAEPQLPDNVLRGWVDGRSYGANGVARMFQYHSNICPLDHNDPISANPAAGSADGTDVDDPKGVTNVGEGHSVTDPKMP